MIPGRALDPLPAVVAHADWSIDPGKRWVAVAVLGADRRYRAAAPRVVGPLPAFLDGLATQAGPADAVFLGFDLPLGLPARYAARAGIDDFRAVLPCLGAGRWRNFFEVAALPGEVTPRRPFYPARAGRRGAVARRHLLDGLGLGSYDDLMRRCDRSTPGRRAAAAMFWTLGPQQVGKAAISAWRDLLIPALAAECDLRIWPFDGPLQELFAPGRIVVAETYPGEIYGHLGVVFSRARRGIKVGKRVQADRAANAAVLLDRADGLGIRLEPALRRAIEQGFGPGSAGEDPFDTTVGLLGMLNVALGNRPAGEPPDTVVRTVEGWILGQQSRLPN